MRYVPNIIFSMRSFIYRAWFYKSTIHYCNYPLCYEVARSQYSFFFFPALAIWVAYSITNGSKMCFLESSQSHHEAQHFECTGSRSISIYEHSPESCSPFSPSLSPAPRFSRVLNSCGNPSADFCLPAPIYNMQVIFVHHHTFTQPSGQQQSDTMKKNYIWSFTWLSSFHWLLSSENCKYLTTHLKRRKKYIKILLYDSLLKSH